MPTKTADPSVPSHVLDNPARASLLGAHARFAEPVGEVLRYHPDVSVFVALPPDPGEQDWRDAAKLLGPGGVLPTAGDERTPPPGWEQVLRIPGVQMVDENVLTPPGIRERGETPFLHTGADNTNAIRLYEDLGFRLRRTVGFAGYRSRSRPEQDHHVRHGRPSAIRDTDGRSS